MKTLQQLFNNGAVWFGNTEGLTAPLPKQKYRIKRQQVSTPFGIEQIDSHLGDGLTFGEIHEWIFESTFTNKTFGFWNPPLFLISHLIGNALREQTKLAAENNKTLAGKKLIAWIGRACWPTPNILEETFPEETIKQSHWIKRSLFIDPPKKKYLWTILQILRCPSVLAVVADVSKLNLLATRRMRLAANKGNVLGLLVRPPWEKEILSAAQTRWLISPVPAQSSPQWSLELFRFPGLVSPRKWFLELTEDEHDQAHSLRLSPNIVGRFGAAEDRRPTTETQRDRGQSYGAGRE